MTRLFVSSDRCPEDWSTVALDGGGYAIGDSQVVADLSLAQGFSAALLPVASATMPSAGWVLLTQAGAAVFVNGEPLEPLRLRVLQHRDYIRAGELRLFVSTERTAEVLPYDGAVGAKCPRCRGVLEAGSPTVSMPCCGIVVHQSAELECFSYPAPCPSCQCEPAPTGSLLFDPREL